jgi:hypothetical protein
MLVTSCFTKGVVEYEKHKFFRRLWTIGVIIAIINPKKVASKPAAVQYGFSVIQFANLSIKPPP